MLNQLSYTIKRSEYVSISQRSGNSTRIFFIDHYLLLLQLGNQKRRTATQTAANSISKQYLSVSRLPKAGALVSENLNQATDVLEELKRLRKELEQTRQTNIILLKEKEEQQRLSDRIHEETIRKVFADEMAKREAATATFWANTLEREIGGVKRDLEAIASKINDSVCKYNPSTSYVREWVNSLA